MIPKYLAIDIETTGLDPKRDKVLEVGWIILTEDLQTISKGEAILHGHTQYIDELADAYVHDMHLVSGLYHSDSDSSVGTLRTRLQNTKGLHLLGFSVHFDRSFLRELIPEVECGWHHRHMDCSSLKLATGFKYYDDNWYRLPPGIILTNGGVVCDMAVGFCACGAMHTPEENRPKQVPHRALLDALLAVEYLQKFREHYVRDEL